jgi:ferredoxin
MAYVITDDCAMCGMCIWDCPNAAISESDETMEIDPARCTQCVGTDLSPQCIKNCPNDAIVLDPAHGETEEQLLRKSEALHLGKTA